MTALREKMDEDMRLRNFADTTRRSYITCVSVFARYNGRSPEQLGQEEVRAFLLHLTKLGRAPASRALYLAALRFLYMHTLGRPEVVEGILRPRVGNKPGGRPLTKEEARALLAAAEPELYVYAFLATILATGLRVSEAIHLRVEDIDSGAGLIHVRQGKGDKQRFVHLSDRHLALLRRYWREERVPRPWLFPGQNPYQTGQGRPDLRWKPTPLSVSGAQQRLEVTVRRSGLQRRVCLHDLRRTYATWLLEAGVDLRVVQMLLGHTSPETTARYTFVRPEVIRATPSAFDLL